MSKVAIVTGGTSGIGFATAKLFLQKGYDVVVASIDKQENIDNSMKALAEFGNTDFVECNVVNPEDCQKVVEFTMEKYKKIDVLANVAGIVGQRKSFLEIDLKDVRSVLDVNLMGTVNLSQLVARAMVATKNGGTIVNVGSICGFIANVESIAYHASKGGIKMLTEAMARELSPYGIRVVSVAPGWVHTSMLESELIEMGSKLHMKGRIIEPEEIAGVIYLMTLPQASAVNGTTVMADDGYSAFKGIEAAPISK